MSRALSTAGFVNYPTEYWHWSYGDRYWAFAKRQKEMQSMEAIGLSKINHFFH